jgi:hypothetical protein
MFTRAVSGRALALAKDALMAMTDKGGACDWQE